MSDNQASLRPQNPRGGDDPQKETPVPKKLKAPQKFKLDAVSIGKLSVGKEKAAVSFEIERSESFDLDLADDVLCGARLRVTLMQREPEPDQGKMFKGDLLSVSSVADVGRISYSKENMKGTLSFQTDDTDIETLIDLVNSTIVFEFQRLGAAGEDPDTGEGDKAKAKSKAKNDAA